jgi:hypothetical protein
MSFNITLTDGSLLTTVDDGTINDTSCSLTLIGKNYVGYGTLYNENLVHLLENFSNDTAPENPITGQLWWDTGGNLNVYNGSNFKTIATINNSITAPTDAVTGNTWWDTTNQQFYVYNGSEWVLIGPAFQADTGTSGLVVQNIVDTDSNTHVVIYLYVGSGLIGIYSKDDEFIPLNPISIKPGFNLISESIIANIRVWGVSYDSDNLGGFAANTYLRFSGSGANSFVINGNITSNNIIANSNLVASNATITSNLTVGNITSSGNIQAANLIVTGNATISSNLTASYFFGNGSYLTGVTSYSNANAASYLPTYTGNLVSLTGNVITTANVYAGNIIATANVIGDYFIGTAIYAEYADLAEKFSSDSYYSAGTLVRIGGAEEITQENEIGSNNVLGVISDNPAYTMNSGLENSLVVALIGKVPVKVMGKVNKGDRLISAGNGFAKSGQNNEINSFNVIGRSLENKYDEHPGSVLTIVRINI